MRVREAGILPAEELGRVEPRGKTHMSRSRRVFDSASRRCQFLRSEVKATNF